MKDYRPLLIEDLGLVLPGLEVLRLRLNEHLPEARPSEPGRNFGFSPCTRTKTLQLGAAELVPVPRV